MPINTAPKLGVSDTGSIHQSERDEEIGDPGGAREKRRPSKADDHLRERKDGQQTDEPDHLKSARQLRELVGEGKPESDAQACDERRQNEREQESLGEEDAQKARIVVENEGGLVKGPLDRAERSSPRA